MELGIGKVLVKGLCTFFILAGMSTSALAIEDATKGFALNSYFLGSMKLKALKEYSSAQFSGLGYKYQNSYTGEYEYSDSIKRINGNKLNKKEAYEIAAMLDNPVISVRSSHANDIFIYDIKRKGVEMGPYILEDGLSYGNPLPEKIRTLNVDYGKLENVTFPEYKEFYIIYPDTLKVQYRGFNEAAVEKMKKPARAKYDNIRSIQKSIGACHYVDVLQKDESFLPVYLYMYNEGLKNKKYGNVRYALEKLEQINKETPVFNQNEINFRLGLIYYMYNQEDKAMEYLLPYAQFAPETPHQFLSFIMAQMHYNLGNTSTCIYYLNQIKSDSPYYTLGLTKAFFIYEKSGNKAKTREYLLKLNNIQPTFQIYQKLINLAYNNTEKLQFCYKARELYNDKQNAYKDYVAVNKQIIQLEQAKIDAAARKIGAFSQRPVWAQYEEELSPILRSTITQQDNFFKKANTCIKENSGSMLKSCFANLKSKENKLVAEFKAEHAADLEYERQYRLQEEMIRAQRSMIEDLRREIRLIGQ